MKARSNKRAGFTLVEVLLVLVILGGIAAVLIPMLGGTRESAEIKLTNIKIKKAMGKLELYRQDIRGYPTDDQGLQALVEKPAFEEGQGEGWSGPYLSEEDLKDAWKRDLHYKLIEDDSSGTSRKIPRVWSDGPNKDDEEGRGDDIKSWKEDEGTT